MIGKEKTKQIIGEVTEAVNKWKTFARIRAYNVAFYKKRDPLMYQQSLTHLIEETKKGRMFGKWNDYGRLLDY